MSAVLPIRLFPDPILRKPAAPVTVFDSSLEALIRKLEAAMRAQIAGIGIAAPQVGIGMQIALIDVSSRIKGAKPHVLINPQILDRDQEKISREGCMSLPDYTGQLKRYDWIRIRYQDSLGALQLQTFTGLEAVCIQHEVDHLNGVLFIDRVASLKRDMIPRPRGKKQT